MLNITLIISFFLLILLTIFRFVKVDVIVNTITNKLLLNIYIYNNFLVFKFKINLSNKVIIQINNKIHKEEEKKEKKAKGNSKFIYMFFNSIEIKTVDVNIKYGTSECDITSQQMYIIKYTLINILQYMKVKNKLKDYNLNLFPQFDNAQLNLSLGMKIIIHPYGLIKNWLHILIENRKKEKMGKVAYE